MLECGANNRKFTAEQIAAIRRSHRLHHTAFGQGYQSVKYDSAEQYSGRFGKGYKVFSHCARSTRYLYVEYYIE